MLEIIKLVLANLDLIIGAVAFSWSMYQWFQSREAQKLLATLT